MTRFQALSFLLCCMVLPLEHAAAQSLPDTTLAFPEHWDAQAGASVDFTQGPITLARVSGDQLVRFAVRQHRFEAAGSQAFGVAEQQRFARDVRAFGRYRASLFAHERSWLTDLSASALAFYERSEPQRHELLTQTGAGGDLTVLRTPQLRMSWTVGYVFEREVFSKLTRPDVVTRQVRDSQLAIWAHRSVFGLELGWEPRPWLHVGERMFAFVPLAHCTCDTKLENSLFLRLIGPGSPFAVQLEAGALYDPRPAVRATQLRTFARSSLILHFE